MVSTPKAPTPPDPTQTAAAQTGTNVDTAIANAALGHTNQVTPDGSLTYNVSGYTTMTDQNGKTYQLPTYTATQSYSPGNKAIYDQTQQTKLGLSRLANGQTQRITDLLGTNVDLSQENIDKYTNDHWVSGFNDTWDRNQASLDQKLADQGIKMGTPAYYNAMADFTKQKQSANDQYLGDMYSNAQNSILTQRNQPINEISALMSGSQISQPNYVNTPSTQLPTVDYSGLINENYNQKLGIYNQQQAASNAAMGGLFGLGSSLLGGWAMSDPRLKHDAEIIGYTDTGLPVYEYEYVWGGGRQVGVMADDVEAVMPEAVAIGPGGFKMVNYARVI